MNPADQDHFDESVRLLTRAHTSQRQRFFRPPNPNALDPDSCFFEWVFNFVIVVGGPAGGLAALWKLIDFYGKHLLRRASVTLKFPRGTEVGLHNLSPDQALKVAREHEEALKGQHEVAVSIGPVLARAPGSDVKVMMSLEEGKQLVKDIETFAIEGAREGAEIRPLAEASDQPQENPASKVER